MNPGIFRKRKKLPVSPSTLLPDGVRIYCIGDIHGRADLLGQIHRQVTTDAAGFTGKKKIVYLGDYIDRGDGSREVIETLSSSDVPGFDRVFLRGNHEQAMLNFCERPIEAAAWLQFGGREALLSYGIALAHIPTRDQLLGLAEQLGRAMPAAHLDFIHSTRLSWRCGGYYFVHAGIRPGIALEKQSAVDQFMIRDEFLSSKKDHGAVIVHGHTIRPEPELLPNRIGIDTGAYDTGVLTCVVLEGNDQRILQTGSPGITVGGTSSAGRD